MSPTEVAALPKPRVAVALLAGGSGTRMGGEVPKPLLTLMGHPLIHYSLRVFESLPEVASIRVGIHPLHEQALERLIAPYPRRAYRGAIPGGATRAQTALAVLEALEPEQPEVVLIHDAARPCITREDVRGLLRSLEGFAGAFLACPAVETLWRVDGEEALDTLDRSTAVTAQTPQAFRFRDIIEAYRSGLADGFEGTDDASFVLRAGGRVTWTPGPRWNLKVTYPEDLAMAMAVLTGGEPCA